MSYYNYTWSGFKTTSLLPLCLLYTPSLVICCLIKRRCCLKPEGSINHNSYQAVNISGLIDPIIGPKISAVQTTAPIIGSVPGVDDELRSDLKQSLPVAAARRVEPRFDDNSVNNTLVRADIGDSVALHCNIWMKQVRGEKTTTNLLEGEVA